ncbi:MAG: single-stranded DNA-binding protein [Candidatus Margulisbacteria bacterium]|nr:single-stranded DNA-binding protein [Candidatus Margulisiibacteriota bacterium]
MSNLNRIILVGFVSTDPELKNTADGVPMAKFSLAVNRPQRADGSAGEVDFIDIVSWRRQAEIASTSLKKGNQAIVEGRVQVRSYDDASGKRVWSTEVVANNILNLKENMVSVPYPRAEEAEPAANNLEDTIPEVSENSEPLPAEEDIPF